MTLMAKLCNLLMQKKPNAQMSQQMALPQPPLCTPPATVDMGIFIGALDYELKKLKAPELKNKPKRRSLDAKGVKPALQSRSTASMQISMRSNSNDPFLCEPLHNGQFDQNLHCAKTGRVSEMLGCQCVRFTLLIALP